MMYSAIIQSYLSNFDKSYDVKFTEQYFCTLQYTRHNSEKKVDDEKLMMNLLPDMFDLLENI